MLFHKIPCVHTVPYVITCLDLLCPKNLRLRAVAGAVIHACIIYHKASWPKIVTQVHIRLATGLCDNVQESIIAHLSHANLYLIITCMPQNLKIGANYSTVQAFLGKI